MHFIVVQLQRWFKVSPEWLLTEVMEFYTESCTQDTGRQRRMAIGSSQMENSFVCSSMRIRNP